MNYRNKQNITENALFDNRTYRKLFTKKFEAS